MTVIQIRVAFYGCINQKTAVGNLCDWRRFAENWPLQSNNDRMLAAQSARFLVDPDGVSQYRDGQRTFNQSWLQMSDVLCVYSTARVRS